MRELIRKLSKKYNVDYSYAGLVYEYCVDYPDTKFLGHEDETSRFNYNRVAYEKKVHNIPEMIEEICHHLYHGKEVDEPTVDEPTVEEITWETW